MLPKKKLYWNTRPNITTRDSYKKVKHMLHAVDAEYTARVCNLWFEETLYEETHWFESWLNHLNNTHTVFVLRWYTKTVQFPLLVIHMNSFIRHWDVDMNVFCFDMFRMNCVERQNFKNATKFSVRKYCLIREGRMVVAIFRIYWSHWSKNRFLQRYCKQYKAKFSWLYSSLQVKSDVWYINNRNIF